MNKLHQTNPKIIKHNTQAKKYFYDPIKHLEFEKIVMQPLHGETRKQWQTRMEGIIHSLELGNSIHATHALNLRRRLGLIKLPKE
jgi:hypothetical protein